MRCLKTSFSTAKQKVERTLGKCHDWTVNWNKPHPCARVQKKKWESRRLLIWTCTAFSFIFRSNVSQPGPLFVHGSFLFNQAFLLFPFILYRFTRPPFHWLPHFFIDLIFKNRKKKIAADAHRTPIRAALSKAGDGDSVSVSMMMSEQEELNPSSM